MLNERDRGWAEVGMVMAWWAFVLFVLGAGCVLLAIATGCGAPFVAGEPSPVDAGNECEVPSREGLPCEDDAGRCQAGACCLACYRPWGAAGPSACVPCEDGGA